MAIRQKDLEFILHLYDLVGLTISYGTNYGEAGQKHAEALAKEMGSITKTMPFEQAQKSLRKVRKLSKSRILEFAEYQSGTPKTPEYAHFETEKVVLTAYHFIELLTQNGFIKLSNDEPLAQAMDWLLNITNDEYNEAWQSGSQDSIIRIETRLEKAKKRADKWFLMFQKGEY